MLTYHATSDLLTNYCWRHSRGLLLDASAAWTLDAEANALTKLIGLLTAHQARQYILTGAFLETSKRSRVTYLFRKLRPTVALTPRNANPLNELPCPPVRPMMRLSAVERA